MKKITLAVIGLLIILGTVAVVAAASLIQSNPITISPQPTPVPASLVLTANTTTPYVGEKVLLTATLSLATPGIAVDFKQDGVTVATVGTSVGGVATYVTTAMASTTARVYTAECTIP